MNWHMWQHAHWWAPCRFVHHIHFLPVYIMFLSQVGTLSARLSATEKALVEANARVTDLNSRLALAETDARLKVSGLWCITQL